MNEKVDIDNKRALQAGILGSIGWSTSAIMRETHLSPGQISYRLKKFDVRRMDYRDGISPVARSIFRRHKIIAEKALRKKLRKLFK